MTIAMKTLTMTITLAITARALLVQKKVSANISRNIKNVKSVVIKGEFYKESIR